MKGCEPVNLPHLVDSIVYKPGWIFTIENIPNVDPDGDQGLALHITINNSSYVRDLEPHVFVLPFVDYNRNTWIAWVFDRIRDVETYIAGENFQVDGVAIFAPRRVPGEDPYRVGYTNRSELPE